MADSDKKISELDEIIGNPAADDLLPIVDVSENKTKRVKMNELVAAVVALDKLPITGGRLTGGLTIGAAPGAPTTYPIGTTVLAASNGLNILSSFNGGDDAIGDVNSADTTGRLNLYSYQRAYVNGYGENIRHFLMHRDSKSMDAWYMPIKASDKTGAYDPTTRAALTTGLSWKAVTWTGAHYEANDRNGLHAHWEVEVPDSTGALQGRLEITFADQATGVVGVDKSYIMTNLSDFVVRCSNGQMLRLSSSNANPKDIEFGNATDGSLRRWKLRVTSETESGANAGSNFQVFRYDDAGTAIDQPIIINRATGQTQIGGNTGSANGLVVNRSTTSAAVTVNNTAAGGTGESVNVADTNGQAINIGITGETFKRFAVLGTGKFEWGDGTASRDTFLYRQAAGLIKTDGNIQLTKLGIGGAPTHQLDMVASTSGLMGVISRSALSDSSPMLQLLGGDTTTTPIVTSIIGDAFNRFGVATDGVLTWGSGSLARDVNLYRSSADVLKTDDSLHVTAGLSLGTVPEAGKFVVASASAGVLAKITRTSTVDAAPMLHLLSGDTASLNLVLSVNGDAQNRFAVDATGKHAWGDGTAARDTTLYRNGVDQLKTDDKFLAALGIGVGNSASATTLGAVTKKMEVFDASGTSLGFVPIYDTIT